MARDNFTKRTRELVAQRVAYRCCFQGCGIATIGPKYGDALNTSSIGVGCHIFAASPNGPRYNANMTPEERKSPDNCIWMCQTHSKLIDADENAYPPALLHQWKNNAEQEAADRLKNYHYSQAELSDKKTLESIFNKLIQDGQYDVLIMLIEQLKASNSADELLLRYEIIYNCYCNRDALYASIKSYIESSIEKECDPLIKILVSLNLKSGLQELIPYCQDEELKKWANAILSDTIQQILFVSAEQADEAKNYNIKDKETALNLLSSFLVEKQPPFLPKQADGTIFMLQENSIAFKIRACSWRLFRNCFNGETFIKDKRLSEDYVFLKNNINKIIQLDKELQMGIWLNCLNYVINDKSEFEQLYRLCPAYIITDIQCERVYIIYNLLHGLKNPNDYLKSDIVINDEKALVSVLQNVSKETKYQFFDEHKYLLDRSSILLLFWAENENICEQEKLKTLLKYQNTYANDFLWNCMVAYYADKRTSAHYLQRAKELLDNITYPMLETYINTLKKHEDWEELKKLFSCELDDRVRYQIILALCSNDTIKNNLYCIKLFKHLDENEHFYEKWFYRNFAVLLNKVGDIAQAKKYYEKEYDSSPDNKVLSELLQIKYSCNDFKIDKYVEIASRENDADLQYIVSAFYGQNNEFDLQKKYLIRSFLINSNKMESLSALFAVYLDHPDEDKFKFGKIYKLQDKYGFISVALLSDSLTLGISRPSVLNYAIKNENAPEFIAWKFCDIEEDVNYEGKSYKIIDIASFSDELSGIGFAHTLKNGAVTQIRGNSPEDAVKKITKLLKNRKAGQQEILKKFNESNGLFPITLLARKLGADYYDAWGTIMEKNNLKLNNYSNDADTDKNYILSNDAFCTLGILDATKDIDTSSIIFAKQTKIDIISMLSAKLKNLQGGSIGSLQFEDGKVYRTDYDKNYKKGAACFWGTLLKFIESIREVESNAFISARQEIANLFIQGNLISERYLLGLAQSDKQSVVVTDEPFICSICELEKIPHISVIDLLFEQNLNHTTILNYLKKLDSFNFLNYFSPKIYKKIVDSAMKVDEENRKYFLGELQEWLIPEKHSEEHSRRIFNTYRELLMEDVNSFYSYTLSDIGRYYFSKLFPEKYQEIIDQLKNIRIEIVPPNDNTDDAEE